MKLAPCPYCYSRAVYDPERNEVRCSHPECKFTLTGTMEHKAHLLWNRGSVTSWKKTR